MADNSATTSELSSVELGADSAAKGVDKSDEAEKQNNTMAGGSAPTDLARAPGEVSTPPDKKAQETRAGAAGSNDGLSGGTNQDVDQVAHTALTIAIKQAVAETLREENILTTIAEIKESLSQIVASVQAAAAVQPAVYPSLEKADEIKESLRQTVLDGYREEYRELSEAWKGLETKAQGTVTIAGIFIAAAFTFAKDLADTRLDFYGNLLLGAAIILLIPSVIFSVLALTTRAVKIPPRGDLLREMVDHLENDTNTELPGAKQGFIFDQAGKWQEVIVSTREAVEEKERWLRTAQGFLLIAIAMAAAVTLKLLRV